MSDLAKSISQTVSPLAIEAAVFPAMHRANCEAWDCQPFDRDMVEKRYGERAALAWDDLQAAAVSFRRAVYEMKGQIDE